VRVQRVGKIMDFFNKLKSPKSPKSRTAVQISDPYDMRCEIHVERDSDGVLQGLPQSWRHWMQAANIRYLLCFCEQHSCWMSFPSPMQTIVLPFFNNWSPDLS